MDYDRSGAAVIGDVVDSRGNGDWPPALLAALERVNQSVPAEQPLAPTVGDEFQGLYATAGAAIAATMLVRLELDSKLDCRFGIGVGSYSEIGSAAISIQAGTAWWSARDAIDSAKELEAVRQPTLRTWYRNEHEAPSAHLEEGPTNAYLLARDHLLTQMDARSRRLLLGIIHGKTQVELANTEGIGQSAVSRNLRRNGAYALIEGADLMQTRSLA